MKKKSIIGTLIFFILNLFYILIFIANNKADDLKVKNLPTYFRVIDKTFEPVMYLFSGLDKEFLQKTHIWHVQQVDKTLINLDNTVKIYGDSDSRIKKTRFGLFHIAIIGGWKDYIVIKPKKEIDKWHIGFYGELENFGLVHNLEINGKPIKLLKTVKKKYTYFFGVDTNGNQIEIELIGTGTKGDGKFEGLSLY